MSRLQISGSDSTGRDSSFTTSTSDDSHASHMSQASPDFDSESLPVSASVPCRTEVQGAAPKRANQQRSSIQFTVDRKLVEEALYQIHFCEPRRSRRVVVSESIQFSALLG